MKLGLSGVMTRAFIDSPLSPLFLVAAFLMGALALAGLPREEEPQISVPMVDVHVRADGLKAGDAVELVTKPLEDIVKGINDVEHVYSQTLDANGTVTARFFVGTDEDDAILRVHEELRAHFDRIPKGIPEPLVVGRGINDVPVVARWSRSWSTPTARFRWGRCGASMRTCPPWPARRFEASPTSACCC
jgi:multidrug efflux pump subunit AcrB